MTVSPVTHWGRLRAWGAKPLQPGFNRERLALLAALTLLLVLRLPGVWIHGRFCGEEGAIFFAYAWHRPWVDALFRSFGGYLNLVANASTLVDARLVQAGVISLETAPYLTMLLALAIQLLPAVVLLTSRAPWLARRWVLIAALFTLAVAPMTEEVFANVLHSQFHLALCAALILAGEVPRSRRAWLTSAVLLFLAPLCGPGAIVLLPFFVLRAIIEWDGRRALLAGIFGLGAAVQLLIFFTPSPVRGQLLGPAVLGAIAFVRLVALPVAGVWLTKGIGNGVHHSYVSGGIAWWSATVVAILYTGMLVAAALTRPRDAAVWLIMPALALAAVSFGGGMIATDPSEWFSVGAGQRYNFLPLVMMTLGLVALAARGQPPISTIAGWLVTLTLAWGTVAFPFPIPPIGKGPSWVREVGRWRRDHNYLLRSWPASWTVDLSDQSHSCSPARVVPVPAVEPNYCEGAWLRQITAGVAQVRAAAARHH